MSSAGVGCAAWVLLWLGTDPPGALLGTVERLFLLAPLVIVPLGLVLSPPRTGAAQSVHRAIVWAQPVAAGFAVASQFFAPGVVSGTLMVPWLLLTALVALYGLLRLHACGRESIGQASIGVGLVYLAVGGAWAFASRSGMTPLGFAEPWVILTANHFHFAGYATPILVGAMGERVQPHAPGAPGASLLRRMHVASTGVVIGGPPLVALGITGSPIMEVVSATLLAVALLLSSVVVLVVVVPGLQPRASAVFVAISALCLVATMGLAATYALGHYLGRSLVAIQTMVLSHGLLNAIGFTLCGMTGLALASPISPRKPLQ